MSIVRLHYLLHGDLRDPDITWNFVDIALWSIIEGNIAVFCGAPPPHRASLLGSPPPPLTWPSRAACLPFLRPVVSKLTFGLLHMSSYDSSYRARRPHGRSSTSRTVSGKHQSSRETGSDGDERPLALAARRGRRSASAPAEARCGGGASPASMELGRVQPAASLSPLDGIVVTRELRMQRQAAPPGL